MSRIHKELDLLHENDLSAALYKRNRGEYLVFTYTIIIVYGNTIHFALTPLKGREHKSLCF